MAPCAEMKRSGRMARQAQSRAKIVEQIADQQELAEYQATLPGDAAATVDTRGRDQ